MALQAFCQFGGFKVFTEVLNLDINSAQYKEQIGGNSFQLFSTILKIVYDAKSYFQPEFFKEIVCDLQDSVKKFVEEDTIDELSLRRVGKKDIGHLISTIDIILRYSGHEK